LKENNVNKNGIWFSKLACHLRGIGSLLKPAWGEILWRAGELQRTVDR